MNQATENVAAPLAVSVLIPTYNPRLDNLQLVLDALRAQTLPAAEWELIVVDNGSDSPVAGRIDLSWHPHGRCVREERRGTLPARVRGMEESRGEILIFVDDDNVLAPDYLVHAQDISARWPMMGTWGGQIKPRFEVTPPKWLRGYWHHLALCEFQRPVWSSFAHDWTVPYGAGMCLRRTVAERVRQRLEDDPRLGIFGRDNVRRNVSGDDQVFSYSAFEAGLGVGRFPELVVEHLIPAARMEPEYFVRLVQGNSHGALLVQLLHGAAARHRRSLRWPVMKYLAGNLLRRGMHRRVLLAQVRGEIAALRQIRDWRPAAATGGAGPGGSGAAPVPAVSH